MTFIDKIVQDLEKKFKYARLLTDLTRKMTIAIKSLDPASIDDLIKKRAKVMQSIDVLNSSIQKTANTAPPQARVKLIELLNGNSLDPKSSISKMSRNIKLELRRSYTIDKENQKSLSKSIKK